MDTRNITNRSDCMAANYRWVHHKYNFDNLGQVSTALLALIRPSPLLDASGSGNHRPGFSLALPGLTLTSPLQASVSYSAKWVRVALTSQVG